MKRKVPEIDAADASRYYGALSDAPVRAFTHSVIRVRNFKDARRLLSRQICLMQRGEISTKEVRDTAYILSMYVNIAHFADIEERIEAIEKAQEKEKQPDPPKPAPRWTDLIMEERSQETGERSQEKGVRRQEEEKKPNTRAADASPSVGAGSPRPPCKSAQPVPSTSDAALADTVCRIGRASQDPDVEPSATRRLPGTKSPDPVLPPDSCLLTPEHPSVPSDPSAQSDAALADTVCRIGRASQDPDVETSATRRENVSLAAHPRRNTHGIGFVSVVSVPSVPSVPSRFRAPEIISDTSTEIKHLRRKTCKKALFSGRFMRCFRSIREQLWAEEIPSFQLPVASFQ